MPGGPAPSFSSFAGPSQPKKAGAPPSFSSFAQIASTSESDAAVAVSSTSAPTAAKRPRAADFLDDAEDIKRSLQDVEPSHKSIRRKEKRRSDDKDEGSSSRDRRHRSHRRDSPSRHDRKDKHASRQAQRDERAAVTQQQRQPAAITRDKDTDEALFYPDRKGDSFNIRYGTLHKGDVPRYRRCGAGRVVGLNDGLRINRISAQSGQYLEVLPLRKAHTPRYLEPASVRQLRDVNLKRIVALPASDETATAVERQTDFVPLSKRVLADAESTVAEEDMTSIKALTAPFRDEPEPDLSSDEEFSLGLDGGLSISTRIAQRNAQLERQAREYPTTIQYWLDFVKFQNEAFLALSSDSSRKALSKAERSSVAEVKMSILERALAVDDNHGSSELLLAYLKAAEYVWDPKKLLRKWKDTLQEFPAHTDLWIKYVEWRQCSWDGFKVDTCAAVYEDCFRVLRRAAKGGDREAVEQNMVYLFLRYVMMLKEAGYIERAVATFQAMIELNLFSPDPVRGRPLEDKLDALEDFWDREVPRFGEEGARGWSESTPDMPVSPRPSSHDLDKAVSHDQPALSRWLQAERRARKIGKRPLRTFDDDGGDPFRVILFSDVRPGLFDISSFDAQEALIYGFLTFVGLPFVPPGASSNAPFFHDHFVRPLSDTLAVNFFAGGGRSRSVATWDIVLGEPVQSERRSDITSPFLVPFTTVPAQPETTFGRSHRWFHVLHPETVASLDVANALSLLAEVWDDAHLKLYQLAFEAAVDSKHKAAKGILSRNRQSLLLWDGYARIEVGRGRAGEARNVYAKALSMYRSFAEQERIDGPRLWRAWAELEWEEGRPNHALRVITAAALSEVERFDLEQIAAQSDTEPPKASQILRVRKTLNTMLEVAFQPNPPDHLLRNRQHLGFMLALLELLLRDVDAAAAVMEQQLFRLDNSLATGTVEHEETLMAYVKLLHRHTQSGHGYRPGQLRDALEGAVSHFPSNSSFLSMFYFNELRTKIQNRFRRLMEDHVLTADYVTSEGFLLAIYAEAHLDLNNVNIWAVRSLFDRAIANDRTRSSASIWMLYIDFEVRNKELKRAKSLVYRALRECPWYQELYYWPFKQPLIQEYRTKELRSMHALLTEKGLRVRIELSDYLPDDLDSDDDEEVRLGGPEGDAGAVQDAEEIIAARTALMPY